MRLCAHARVCVRASARMRVCARGHSMDRWGKGIPGGLVLLAMQAGVARVQLTMCSHPLRMCGTCMDAPMQHEAAGAAMCGIAVAMQRNVCRSAISREGAITHARPPCQRVGAVRQSDRRTRARTSKAQQLGIQRHGGK